MLAVGIQQPVHQIPLAAGMLPAAAERRQAAGCLAAGFVGKNSVEGRVEAPLPFVESPALAEVGPLRLAVSLLVDTY